MHPWTSLMETPPRRLHQYAQVTRHEMFSIVMKTRYKLSQILEMFQVKP